MSRGRGPTTADSIALSVHGPAGVLDLAVPPGASAADLAREYAAQSGLGAVPLLFTRIGAPLVADVALAEAGVVTGDVLVATTSVHRPAPPVRAPLVARSAEPPGPLAVLWFGVAAALAVLSGWFATRSTSPTLRAVTVDLLVAAALLGVVPLGRYAAHRALAAPAFGAAAAGVLVWDDHPERLPMVLGIAALAAAVTAAFARSLAEHVEEGLRVWLVAGGAVFLVSGLAALVGLPAAVTWSTLLVGAMLAARFVPSFAVDVPDQLLLDLERLAVTAWSARDRPRGRRGRVVASPQAVAAVARSGASLVTAAGVGVAVVAVVSAGLLLGTVTADLDRIGARCLVFFAGAALLLAARSYRHVGARGLLRLAGLGCWALLAHELLATSSARAQVVLAGGAIGLALVLVVVAVATGRGWRSVWWARRAEVAEGVAGAAALASVLVATGLFRTVWLIGSRIAP